jgi:hypothetical protein
MRCFENFLDVVNLTYFGPQKSGGVQTRPDSATRLQNQASETSDDRSGEGRASCKNTASNKNLSAESEPEGAPQLDSKQDSEAKPGSSERVVGGVRGESKRMRLSYLDYLVNPLRSDHPFGKCPI